MMYRDAYAKALRLLHVRFLSVRELRSKLMERGAEENIIDEVVETLLKERFLDDDRLAHDVYRYYAGKKKYGHRYIVQRLHMRGLPVPEDIERADEYAIAAAVVQKKFSTAQRDYAKAARYLQYRGFAAPVIQAVLSHGEYMTERR